MSDYSPSILRNRILAKIEIDSKTSCWLWIGAKYPSGYGCLKRTIKHPTCAHRVSYEVFIGPVPKDMQLDHLCRVKSCVNPLHLEIVTSRENLMRGIGPTAKNAAKTHCVHGHAFTKENTKYTRSGWRFCRTCKNLKQNLRYRVSGASIRIHRLRHVQTATGK